MKKLREEHTAIAVRVRGEISTGAIVNDSTGNEIGRYMEEGT